MDEFDKTSMIERLAQSYSSISGLLEGGDLDIVVYNDADWRIRDIIGHISTWDRQVTKSLIAFNTGSEYSIPEFDEDAFNQQQVDEARELTSQQVVTEFEEARKEFIGAVEAIPLDRFPGDVLFPWGDERGSISRLVRYMLEHDDEHRVEIKKALQSKKWD